MTNETEAPTEASGEASSEEVREGVKRTLTAAHAKAETWARHAVEHGDEVEAAFAHLYAAIILAKSQGSDGFEFVKLAVNAWDRVQVVLVEVDDEGNETGEEAHA